jgi:hypothetical protein
VWILIGSHPVLQAQSSSKPPLATSNQQFDPHDLTGTWTGENRPGSDRWGNPIPEPPLTEWAKQNLLYKEGISHDSISGTLVDPSKAPYPGAPDSAHLFYKADLYGVPANVIDGEYPGKDCEPLAPPAMFDYINLNLVTIEIFPTPDRSRIFELFEYHREWRTFWLNREHPKDLDPTYEGDSTARWEGDTLVVDTIGFNGKTMVMGVVGHRKSDAFRLEERYRRVDHDHLEIDMTYYDPKAWGDKSWPGFKRYLKLTAPEKFQEFICSPREYMEYDKRVTDAATGKQSK